MMKYQIRVDRAIPTPEHLDTLARKVETGLVARFHNVSMSVDHPRGQITVKVWSVGRSRFRASVKLLFRTLGGYSWDFLSLADRGRVQVQCIEQVRF